MVGIVKCIAYIPIWATIDRGLIDGQLCNAFPQSQGLEGLPFSKSLVQSRSRTQVDA